MTKRRVENTRVHFRTFLPVSVNFQNNLQGKYLQWGAPYFVISEPENRTK